MPRKTWNEIKAATMSADEIANAKTQTDAMLSELPLAQLRKAVGMAQATVAQILGVSQGEVSRMERRPDLYISTLRRYLEAMNGELVLVARFPGQPDRTLRLEELEEPSEVERQYGDFYVILRGRGEPGQTIGYELSIRGKDGFVVGGVPPGVTANDLEDAQQQIDELLAERLHARPTGEWRPRA